ncbi:hypothetical protein L293_0587 [Acinetobacter gyllenbergii CIP 110306 = MTCC 11365]|nr:hypothetical protein L293_0587 [Acinetobacter gyllenbergii CIP 110306 = MTCC 11365]
MLITVNYFFKAIIIPITQQLYDDVAYLIELVTLSIYK